jgi:arylsulfatase
MILKIILFFKQYAFEWLLMLFSVGIPFALDMGPAFYGILATFFIFLTLRRLSYWSFFVVFLFVLITCVLFLPQIIWFGHPPVTMIGAFFETDLQESKEFVQSLPLYSYAISLLTLLFGGYILYLGKKKTYLHNKKQNLITAVIAILAIGLTLYRPLAKMKEYQAFKWSASRTAIISFYASIYDNIQEYQALKEELSKGIEGTPTWQITATQPPYQNYVLIIGESVRKDYMHLYGFPEENTPFLDKAYGTVIDGYTATAANTTASLLRSFMQMKGDKDFIYANNLISLAKNAGFETFWLSNQGLTGEFDTPIAKLAFLCDHKEFTKKGDYASMNYHDSILLPLFSKYLHKKSHSPRLFILHIMGSHVNFESRLEHPIHYNYYNRKISAYIQTIEQTDTLLKDIHELLQKNGDSFSILYFSDHGLMTQDRNSMFTSLTHGDTNPNKACYQVPFVLLSSDDTQHKVVKANKSAFRFLDGFAHWLGIQEASLRSDYDFLSPKNDTLKVFNQYENVPFEGLEEDEIMTNN